jgi:lactate permease
MFSQVYNPLHNILLSALVAAIPIVVLLGAIAFLELKAHIAALLGLAASLAVAIFAFGMPAKMAFLSAGYGAAFGLLPIGWIILNVIFLHQLTVEKGYFKILQNSIATITPDRRLQLLLIAFSFGAFFEGAAGFGTPVAVTGAILMGLGFRPLAASGLCLIANTAPVAFGALGAPVIALAAVTGLDLFQLSGMIGRILPFFSLIIPFWLVWTFAGFRGILEVWPAILVSGACFAGPQFLVSNFHGPWLVDIIAAIVSLAALTLFLRWWHPRKLWLSADLRGHEPGATVAAEADPAEVVIGNPGGHGNNSRQAVGQNTDAGSPDSRADTVKAWLPWVILTVFVFLWGIPQMRGILDALFGPKLAIPGLDQLVQKMPPIVPKPHAEAAIYNLNLLSATGSGILFAAGWLGVALTGSDTASNVLFGGHHARRFSRCFAHDLGAHLIRLRRQSYARPRRPRQVQRQPFRG